MPSTIIVRSLNSEAETFTTSNTTTVSDIIRQYAERTGAVRHGCTMYEASGTRQLRRSERVHDVVEDGDELLVTVGEVFVVADNVEIREAVQAWCTNRTVGEMEYGHISDWNVSAVTDMSKLFEHFTSFFNQPLNAWDVSNVTDMSGMFRGASNTLSSFNQPLNEWDVSNVTDMSEMFRYAINFDQPLNVWDVSNVTNMSKMFSDARAFNQPLNEWDVSNVTDMSKMFCDCIDFNQPLNEWDVSNVTNMSEMFSYAQNFNQPLNEWDVSNVTDMSGMFKEASINQPLNEWDVSNVTNMSGMFNGANIFNQPLDEWDVSYVRDMRAMFFSAQAFKQFESLTSWNTCRVKRMSQMFGHNTKRENRKIQHILRDWNTTQVVDLREMYFGG